MACNIRVLTHHKNIEAKKGDNLVELLHKAGIPLNSPCGQKGLCGKCLVRIVAGHLPPPQAEESVILQSDRLKRGYRLACLYQIKGDASLHVPEESLLKETPALQTGLPLHMTLDPPVKKYRVQDSLPPKEAGKASMAHLILRLQENGIYVPSDFQTSPPLQPHPGQPTAVVYEGTRLITLEPPDAPDECFGLAVDIGTTTVSAGLVDLNTGDILDTLSALNRQVKRGADIISRISIAATNPGQAELLRQDVLATVNDLIWKLLRRNNTDPLCVYDTAVSGNTVMNHLFLGFPVDTLAVCPFYEVFTRLPSLPAHKIGIKLNDFARTYIAPNIHSYIGGDISSGLTASAFLKAKGNCLYIDLGTNGEIVLKRDEKITATSAAAGPAFEGVKISCGMPAFPGAVYRADLAEKIELSTLDSKDPVGICGTGLIDITAGCLERGWISPKGIVRRESKEIPLTDELRLTQKDIREIQLATGAVKTAIKMLIKENDLTTQDLDAVFIAGAFGNYLNIKNTMRIGLLPSVPEDRIRFIGNASLAGARALLLSRQARSETEKTVDKIRFLSLASNKSFQTEFMKSLDFSPY